MKFISNRAISLMSWVFANGPEDQGSISVAIEKGAFGSTSTKVANFTYFKPILWSSITFEF